MDPSLLWLLDHFAQPLVLGLCAWCVRMHVQLAKTASKADLYRSEQAMERECAELRKNVDDQMNVTRQDLYKTNIGAVEKFVPNTRLVEVENRIETRLGRIEEKLDDLISRK